MLTKPSKSAAFPSTKSHIHKWLLGLGCLVVASQATNADDRSPSKDQLEFFERKVRPLLAEHCYSCHSTKAKKLQAGLLVDSRHGLLEGGDSGTAIVAGKPDESLLIEAVRYETYEMPPKGKLSDENIHILEKWIADGAAWPAEDRPQSDIKRPEFDLEQRKDEHWVWQPIKSPTLPSIKNRDWPLAELDYFVLNQIEKTGLEQAVDAERLAVFRRVYLDLIGLPPTRDETAAFVKDTSPEGLERVVDRLLQSPHFGERWGRHWLDLVRYAESRGHEFDNDSPNAFQYRDYVIRALNADVPYDQFVREHIAGDLLENPRLHPTEKYNESILGTGFWYLGEWVHSPVDIRKDEADRFDNMLDVMSKTFLGVTVACARCHDHKFDAISTADYYSLSGFLQSSDYRQVRFQSLEQNRQVAQSLKTLDQRYQTRLRELLKENGIEQPTSTNVEDDPSVIVDYGNIEPTEYIQDGFVFGHGPRQPGQIYLTESGWDIAKYAAATHDPFWYGLRSVTEGTVHNRDALARLPKSGRTLRTPTFEVQDKTVACLVSGMGHVIACVDSHRLVAGPLHGQTIRPIKTEGGWVTLDLSRYIGHRVHLEFVPKNEKPLSVSMVVQGNQDLARIKTRFESRSQEQTKYAQGLLERLGVSASNPELETQVFADFESGDYSGWTSTGDAFGDKPQTTKTLASYQGDVKHRGTFFVNSHNRRHGNEVDHGDHLTGRLTSPVFTINFEKIEFLIGGGSHKEKTCVNLVVDGKTVLSATGASRNQMSLNEWNVRRWQGKRAQIEVVDEHQGGWGNIGIDHVVFLKRKQRESKHLKSDPFQDNFEGIITEWKRERAKLREQVRFESRVAPAMLDGTGEDDHVLIRGNASKQGRLEPRHFLTAITGNDPMQIATGSGRLELASEINAAHNPLTRRVIVNRIWHLLMGRGIVASADDFGVLGQRPTHPQLLDHLATKFTEQGQSIKQMIKYIVLSRTYQMSTKASQASLSADPKNLLWHYRPPKRLQGEAIRDSLLALSGKLDPQQFGPPVPIHLTAYMDGRGRPGKNGPLDGAGRRSIYISVRRNFISPFMLAFDTPIPFSTMGKRNVSNVPAQALILMNDPFVVQQARGWAERALQDGKDSNAGIRWLYWTGFAREPTPRELETARRFIGEDRDVGRWADLAHALINTKEFIYLR